MQTEGEPSLLALFLARPEGTSGSMTTLAILYMASISGFNPSPKVS